MTKRFFLGMLLASGCSSLMPSGPHTLLLVGRPEAATVRDSIARTVTIRRLALVAEGDGNMVAVGTYGRVRCLFAIAYNSNVVAVVPTQPDASPPLPPGQVDGRCAEQAEMLVKIIRKQVQRQSSLATREARRQQENELAIARYQAAAANPAPAGPYPEPAPADAVPAAPLPAAGAAPAPAPAVNAPPDYTTATPPPAPPVDAYPKPSMRVTWRVDRACLVLLGKIGSSMSVGRQITACSNRSLDLSECLSTTTTPDGLCTATASEVHTWALPSQMADCVITSCELPFHRRPYVSRVNISCLKQLQATPANTDMATVMGWIGGCRDAPTVSGDCIAVAANPNAECVAITARALGNPVGEENAVLVKACATIEQRCR